MARYSLNLPANLKSEAEELATQQDKSIYHVVGFRKSLLYARPLTIQTILASPIVAAHPDGFRRTFVEQGFGFRQLLTTCPWD